MGTHLKKKTEVIKESEVPVSLYAPDAKGVPAADADRFTVPVKKDAETATNTRPQELEVEDEKVIPLEEDVYKTLPPTMQKMSVMGKVVIVTG